jgi:hypothetical protein
MAFTKRVFTFPTFAGAVARCAALNVALGYPKTEGRAVDARSPAPRQVLYFVRPKRTRAGSTLATQGIAAFVILPVDYPPLAALDGQTLTVPATYLGRSVPGAGQTFTLNLAAGRAFSKVTDNDSDEEDF